MQPMNSSYPATLTFEPPERVANWRPLLNWLLAIPHFIILYGLRILAEVVSIISWFVILFTGELPESFANIQSMYLRYEIRAYTYALFMREEYPPFTFAMTQADSGEEPRLRVDFRAQLTDRNRLTVGFRIILVIPAADRTGRTGNRGLGDCGDRILRCALHWPLAGRNASLCSQCDALVPARPVLLPAPQR